MKSLIVILVLCALSLTCRADTLVDYSLSVVNAPGGIGDFSWTVQTDGFIEVTPNEYVNQMCVNCDRYNFTQFASVSAPSNGAGCGISKVLIDPEYAIETFFSPLCDGLYDATEAGDIPVEDTFGTWSWTWTNLDNTLNYVTLSITDPPAVPEPVTWKLLLCGLGMAWVASKIKL